MEYPSFDFSLRQLQYAVAVADSLSFRKAAVHCHVSQPSLSAQLAQLETSLGIQLFERGRSGVLITESGRGFIKQARVILRETEDLVEGVRRESDPFSGTLRIGAIPTIAPYLLPDMVPALRTEYPRMSFVWVEEKTATLVERLGMGELDAAILALEAPLGEVSSCVMGKDPFVLAMPKEHPLARSGRPVQRKSLDGERVLLLEDGHCFREQALSWCSTAGAEEAGYRGTSLQTLMQMVAGGAGVTLLPTLALDVENRRGTLEVRRFASKAPYRTIALVWRKHAARSTTLATLGAFLADTYTKLEHASGQVHGV